ncbi:MAG: MlaE family lipid ABC transporter permease subunit [Pseudomonadota bacterium]
MALSRKDERARAALVVRSENAKTILEPTGDWVVETIGQFDRAIARVESEVAPGDIVIDLSGLGRIDTAGAYLLGRAVRRCGDPDGDFHFIGENPAARRLMQEVRERTTLCPAEPDDRAGFIATMERIGEGAIKAGQEAFDTIAFFGRTIVTLARTIADPRRLRLTPTIYLMETAGVNALPIIAVLSFFIGAVVAYMGANLLATFGASIFTVELVGFSVLREFGVLITAIMLAGRSDSAFTAAIGSMKMQQEIDAMQVIGLDPYEALVLPRVIACVIMAPLLTFAAMLSGVFGGMLVAWSTLDIAPGFFVARLQQTVDWSHFWVGMSKAPVFGLVIAIIGCRQGMEVGGDVESLGSRTTASVVQSIFAVIVIDAMFAMMYLELDI